VFEVYFFSILDETKLTVAFVNSANSINMSVVSYRAICVLLHGFAKDYTQFVLKDGFIIFFNVALYSHMLYYKFELLLI
jgi:hypothetical protein